MGFFALLPELPGECFGDVDFFIGFIQLLQHDKTIAVKLCVVLNFTAVSYTHLDVYKRQIADCVQGAYNTNFDTPEIAPLVKLNDKEYILELWHGPTAAFKDMALQLTPRLLVKRCV